MHIFFLSSSARRSPKPLKQYVLLFSNKKNAYKLIGQKTSQKAVGSYRVFVNTFHQTTFFPGIIIIIIIVFFLGGGGGFSSFSFFFFLSSVSAGCFHCINIVDVYSSYFYINLSPPGRNW